MSPVDKKEYLDTKGQGYDNIYFMLSVWLFMKKKINLQILFRLQFNPPGQKEGHINGRPKTGMQWSKDQTQIPIL